MKLVLASQNKKKLAEMNDILSHLGVEVCSEAEAGVDLAALSLGGFFTNLIPVTIGNIIGGCGFGALIWACHRTSK